MYRTLIIVGLVVALCGGGAGAGAVVWRLKDFWFQTIEEPRIRKDQRDKDVAEFEAIAEAAKRELELKVFKFVERLQQEFWDQQKMADDWHQAEVDLLEDRISDYENGLGEDDRSCGLTDGDLLFLGGVREERGAPGRGHGQGASGRDNSGSSSASRLH